MRISLTGNPFVDTGLAVLASKSNCESIDDLTLEKMKKVHDGNELARRNSKLKSTSIIFTTNNLLTQPAIKPPEKRLQLYSAITTALLNKVGFEDVHERCESCGNECSLNLDALIRKTLVGPSGLKDETRYVGRDWFPLAGSMGSDAQALPASSRSLNLCAKCLFSVHYLPQGVILREGKLTVFQSTSTELWYDLVKSINIEIDKRIMAGKFENLGAKEGSSAVLHKTFDAMRELKRMGSGISLFIWMFSNSGQRPDCKIEELPNYALQFLFKAYVSGYEADILQIVSKDGVSENSFLYCISAGKDYFRLYPHKKSNGVSPELFMLYQTEICKVQKASLLIAHKIAHRLREVIPDKKKYDTLIKEITKFSVKNRVRGLIVEMVADGSLSYNDYIRLFAEDCGHFIGIKNAVWKYIAYFAFNTDWTPNEPIISDATSQPLLQYIARQIFLKCIAEKGENRFKKEVMNKFAIKKIGTTWLRRQFLKNAINVEGFDYNAWKSLSSSQNEQENFYEALYRFRLLWTEWLRTPDSIDNIEKFTVQNQTDGLVLPSDIKADVYQIVDDYLDKWKRERFEKEVVNDLVTGEKGLWWFKQRLVGLKQDYYDERFWEIFLTSEEGYSIASIRLFQLSLELINYYRTSF